MHMKMINLASVSRKKSGKHTNNEIVPLQVFNRIDDFNNIIVMSGTAKRKPINQKEKGVSSELLSLPLHKMSHRSSSGLPSSAAIKVVEKNSLKENFMKLRPPSYKSHHKQVHAEDKLMTKSCEVLFECIKPYKDIRVARNTNITESETLGSISKTNAVVYERKATRKIQFFTFSEEIPSECFLWDEPQTSTKLNGPVDFNMGKLEVQNVTKSLITNEEEAHQWKTVSSEDFVTNVLSEAGII